MVEVDRLTKQFGILQRTIYYNLQQIDDWLEEIRLTCTQRIYGKGIYLDPDTKRKLQKVTTSITTGTTGLISGSAFT